MGEIFLFLGVYLGTGRDMEISINQSYSINGSKIIRSFITRNVFTLCGKANTDYRTSLLQITINHERSKPKLFSLIVRSCLSFQTGIFRKILDKWMISDLSEKPLQDAETDITWWTFNVGNVFTRPQNPCGPPGGSGSPPRSQHSCPHWRVSW